MLPLQLRLSDSGGKDARNRVNQKGADLRRCVINSCFMSALGQLGLESEHFTIHLEPFFAQPCV